MKTLIIHPDDPSTDVLRILYEPIKDNATIVTSGSYREVEELIKSHDRIMMMGHGSPGGLFSVHQFSGCPRGYVIDHLMVPLLRKKEDSVFIWCHASDFVSHHGLSGFASGMFISEVGEAEWCGVRGADQTMVDASNVCFMEEAAIAIRSSAEDLFEQTTKGRYEKLSKTNPVAAYNIRRLRLF